jgi:hypothetical protein
MQIKEANHDESHANQEASHDESHVNQEAGHDESHANQEVVFVLVDSLVHVILVVFSNDHLLLLGNSTFFTGLVLHQNAPVSILEVLAVADHFHGGLLMSNAGCCSLI